MSVTLDSYNITDRKMTGASDFETDKWAVCSFKGKSTDTKPVTDTHSVPGAPLLNIVNGSSFFEMDTKNIMFYDEDTTGWL